MLKIPLRETQKIIKEVFPYNRTPYIGKA